MGGRYVVLDSWRGVAALMVAVRHFYINSHVTNLGVVAGAYLWVDFFFVLSGFVVASAYRDRLLSGFGVGPFMLLRWGRLAPLHLCVLAVFVAIWLFGTTVLGRPIVFWNGSLRALAEHVLMLHGTGLAQGLRLNYPSWSISSEFFTYLIYAVALVRFGPRLSLSILTVFVCTAVIGLASDTGMDTTYKLGLVRALLGFSVGVAVEDLRRRTSFRLAGSGATVAELGLVAAALALMSIAGRGSLGLAAPLLFGLMVFVFADEAGAASRLLGHRLFRWIGALSYSIYMLHALVQVGLREIGRALDAAGYASHAVGTIDGTTGRYLGATLWQGDIYMAAMLVATVALAALAFRYVEQPAREWTRRRVLARSGRSGAAMVEVR